MGKKKFATVWKFQQLTSKSYAETMRAVNEGKIECFRTHGGYLKLRTDNIDERRRTNDV